MPHGLDCSRRLGAGAERMRVPRCAVSMYCVDVKPSGTVHDGKFGSKT